MDDMKFNQEQGQNAPAAPEKSKGKKGKIGIIVLIVIIILGLAYIYKDKLSLGGTASLGADSGYQAVFMTNGQVYFGKISNATSPYATLRDVFYLQVVEPPLQGSDQGDAAAAAAVAAAQPQISLVKLGNELHGPVDEMQINREHILFYEDLKNDSQVVQAINAFKEGQQQ